MSSYSGTSFFIGHQLFQSLGILEKFAMQNTFVKQHNKFNLPAIVLKTRV